jgi:hypothetical protein
MQRCHSSAASVRRRWVRNAERSSSIQPRNQGQPRKGFVRDVDLLILAGQQPRVRKISIASATAPVSSAVVWSSALVARRRVSSVPFWLGRPQEDSPGRKLLL